MKKIYTICLSRFCRTTFKLSLLLLFTPFAFGQLSWLKLETGLEFSIGLRSDHTLWAWGANVNGQLGIGSTATQLSPVQVGADTTWREIAAGGFHMLAIKSDGTLWTWGSNGVGQLGIGNNVQKTMPVQVGTETNWKKVYAGQGHSFAIREDNSVWCWGYNTTGQLGLGNTANQNTPVQLTGETAWLDVSCGGAHTLVVKSDGTLWAFGENSSGQLGYATNTQRTTAVQIGTDNTWVEVSAGYEFSLARKADGTIWAWGANGNGQLGLGNSSSSNVPQQTGNNLTDWLRVEAGSAHAFAINTSHELFTWGYNASGQLGSGTTTQYNTMLQLGFENDWNEISAASGAIFGGALLGMHSLGLRGNNQTICATGANYAGQLGAGLTQDIHFFTCETGDLSAAVNELVKDFGFSVYPNPSTGLLSIQVTNTVGPLRCTVLNSVGQLILEKGLSGTESEIDLQGMESGIYFIRVQSEGHSKTERVIIE